MAIPKFNALMIPLLREISDGEEYRLSDISDTILEKYFELTEEEKNERVSNGSTRIFDRLHWAKTYLKKATLLKNPQRGFVQITEEGKRVLSQNIEEITIKFLMKYKSFKEFKARGKNTNNPKNETPTAPEEKSPSDLLEEGYQSLKASLEDEILEKLKSSNPYYFEKIMLKLLKNMGYGDVLQTSKSRDGGIDGIINQDKLGLEKIYIQAKRFTQNSVREPQIRNFIGAMSGDVRKGIFVTTSFFDKKAVEKAKTAMHTIILIDGKKLSELMVDYDIGVNTKFSYDIKEIDSDFFEEE